jgi:hypothetical protein
MNTILPAPKLTYRLQCIRPDGSMRWEELIDNLVMTGGRNDLMDKYFSGSGYTAAWFVGLINNAAFSAIAAGDTMASHAGWAETAPYSNATRPAVSWNSAASGSKAASAASTFLINATATVRGAFLTTGSAKSGTAGILYSAATFPANRSVVNLDQILVTPTVTAA